MVPRTSPARTLLLGAVLGLSALAPAGLRRCDGERPALRVATFNIEMYPKSPRQPELAFATIRSLDAPAVAVQEISEPAHFEAAARIHLGESWRFVHATSGARFRVGVLFDEARLALRSTRTYDDTIVRDRARPAFEVRLDPRAGGVVRLIVVHLQCCEGGLEDRRLQLERLLPIVDAARASGERVLVLGDFNTIGALDRARVAVLAARSGTVWASEGLACTAYWRPGGECQGSALDHVLAWRPVRVAARGPCESEGCSPGRSCPVFHREVSDHCPLTVDLP